MRHGHPSLLIAQRLNVVFVSRQLGHASPATTLEVYAHLFQQADHAVAAREALQASFEAVTRAASHEQGVDPVVTAVETAKLQGGGSRRTAPGGGDYSPDYRDAGEAFQAAARAAGLRGQGRLSVHLFRHGYASLPIAQRLNVVFVSRQLAHTTVMTVRKRRVW